MSGNLSLNQFAVVKPASSAVVYSTAVSFSYSISLNFFVWGTWNGATVKLQMAPDIIGPVVKWFDVASYTADDVLKFQRLGPCQLRVLASALGASSNLNWVVSLDKA